MIHLTPASDPATDRRRQLLRLKTDLHRTVVEAVDLSRIEKWSPERLRSEMRQLTTQVARDAGVRLSDDERTQVSEDVIDELFGLGPLEPFMTDPSITEILANGPNDVYVERNGRLERTGVQFTDAAHLMRVVQRLASRIGRRVDESSPMVDARLTDGSRVNAVLPPLTTDGPVLSIRRFGQAFRATDLVERGSVPPEVMEFLKAAVESRINILISGGSGAGKTTFLNVLSAFIPSEERLVTIEDTLELRLLQPHVVRMEARQANAEGQGEVTQRSLLRNALRMRPDRIIVGEVRGPEVVDMLQAMNTGHEGSLTTVHANDTRDALSRLEMMVGMSGFEVPVEVLRKYVSSAITLVVHLSRLKGGERRLTRVSEVAGFSRKRKSYAVRDLFEFRQTGVEGGRAVGHFRVTGKTPRIYPRMVAAGASLPPDMFNPRTLPGRHS